MITSIMKCGFTAEIWEWIRNFILQIRMDEIAYQWWDLS